MGMIRLPILVKNLKRATPNRNPLYSFSIAIQWVTRSFHMVFWTMIRIFRAALIPDGSFPKSLNLFRHANSIRYNICVTSYEGWVTVAISHFRLLALQFLFLK